MKKQLNFVLDDQHNENSHSHFEAALNGPDVYKKDDELDADYKELLEGFLSLRV